VGSVFTLVTGRHKVAWHRQTLAQTDASDFGIIDMDLSTSLIVKNYFRFGKTGNSVGERRLMSNATLTVERCDTW